MNIHPTPENIELLKRDSNEDGVPDIITNPEEILDQITLPNGKPLGTMQKKIIMSMMAGMGKDKVIPFLAQIVGEAEKKHSKTADSDTSAIRSAMHTKSSTSKHMPHTSRPPGLHESQSNAVRIGIFVVAFIAFTVFYFFIAR